MRGRGKAPLAMALLHLRPLVIQIQGQGAGDPLAPGQGGASGNDEAETRNALDALVRAADQEVDSQLADVNGNAAEAAHGVHDERQPAPADRPGDDLHGIQNARGGLTVHHGQVGDVRVFLLGNIPYLLTHLDAFRFPEPFSHFQELPGQRTGKPELLAYHRKRLHQP